MKYRLTYIFLILSSIVLSQKKQDSLLSIISNSKNETVIAKTFLELAKNYETLKKEKALEYIKKGLKVSIKNKNDSLTANLYHTKAKIYDFHKEWNTAVISYKKAIKFYRTIKDSTNTPKCFQNIGVTEYFNGNYKKAIDNYKLALSYYLKNNDTENAAATYNNIALLYKTQGNYIESINIHLKSLKLKEKSGNKYGIAVSFQNIGVLFWEQQNYKQALKYFKNSAKIFKKLDDKIGVGSVYVNLGLIYKEKKDTATAMEYYNKAIKILNNTNEIKVLATAIINKAVIFDESGNIFKAEQQYLKTLKLCEKINYNTGVLVSKIGLSRIYSKKGNKNKSLKYAIQAVEISKKSSSLKYISDAYLTLAKRYKENKMYDYAYNYIEKYHILKDSIFSLEKNKQINDIKTKYETEKKEAKIKILEKNVVIKNLEINHKNKRIKTITFFLLLTIGLFTILFIIFLQKRKAYLHLVEQNILLAKKDIETEDKLKTHNIKEKTKNKINNKYSESQLDEKYKKELKEDIIILMEEEKYFLNSGFTIKEFAEELNTNRSYISQIINEYFNTNFNNFVNEYRVREARKLLICEEYKNYSIEGISSTVGFHSKATFNNAFKKFTGVTPSFFQKNSRNV